MSPSGLLTKEELDVLDSERVVGFVGSSLAIFSRTEEEEESDPGEVADGLLTVGVGLVGLLEGLEDGDCNGTELGRNRVLFHVGCKLSSQEKSDLAQLVVLGVVVPHGCEDLDNQPKVLFHKHILDGSPCGCQDSGTDTLGEDLEGSCGIGDAL